MYTITFNGFPIYDPRDDSLCIQEPAVHLAVGEPGTVSFLIDYDHPNIAQLTQLQGILELTEDGVPLFRGRIVRDSADFDKARNIEAEGLLACLNDSIIPPYDFPNDFADDPAYQTAAGSGNVVAFFLGWLLEQHNAQVTDAQKINLGTVTVSDPNNYVVRSSGEYGKTWDVLTDKLPNSSLGGYILPRYEDDGVYLDYLSDFPLSNVQAVEFGENLLDLLDEHNAAEIFSQILPVGADGLTIAELPDGAIPGGNFVKSGKIIYSPDLVSEYGKITKTQTWNDVTEAVNLRTKAAAVLAESGVARTIQLTACDLHLDGLQSFRVGRYTQLTSATHGFSANYPLMELDIDILDPGATEITLGRKEITQTGNEVAAQAKTEERADQQQIQLDLQAGQIAEVKRSATEQITTAIQNSQAIIFQALESYVETGDLEQYKRTVATQFSQTARQIELSFATATEQINSVNGDLQAKYSERLKYIRFVDGNIVLGEDGNEITLTIENDRLSFRQKGQEVAYFANNKLFVNDAEFLVSVIIGGFAYTPGVGGNLSFKKVR